MVDVRGMVEGVWRTVDEFIYAVCSHYLDVIKSVN